MYLKSLEIQGFKSFPDKVTLSFDKGVTAVVGPNGSGKSNISDAVRWVLGEQSTKTLRGSKMEDVIFSGTQKRKPMGFALVTLNIDNSEGTIADVGNEISVSRKYYRSGDSEYRLNGKNVRLRDIHELFMDTGLGRDGYSMIGQGRVSEIVGVKSEERRSIFEEAAGISKFRYKKEDAQRKLAAAQDNLVRIQDIVSELEVRVEPLRKQSEKAKEYIALANEQKEKDISLWNFQLDELKKNQDELESEILVSKAEFENLENDISAQENKIEDGYEQLHRIDISLENARLDYEKSQNEISRLKSENAVLENDIKHKQESIKRVNQQIEEEKSGIENLKQRAVKREKLKVKLSDKKEKLTNKLEQTDSKIKDVTLKIIDINKKSEEEKENLIKLYAKQSTLNAQIDSLRANIDLQSDDSAKQQKELETFQNDYNERNEALEGIIYSLEQLEKKSAETENSINKKSSEVDRFSDVIKETQSQHNKIVSQLSEKQNRHRILSDLEKNMEGFSGSVKAVLRASQSQKLVGIHGTVAQLINVSKDYGVAIETALGGAMQNIIVSDEQSAKDAIMHLKQTKAGRCTFLPLTSIKGRNFDYNLENDNGFLSIASEIVEYKPEYKSIVSSLLGRIAIVDNIDNAALIAKKYKYSFKIVTLDGQVVNAGGSFTGGSAQRSGGMLTRHSEIDEIAKQIETLKEKSAKSEADLEYLNKNLKIKQAALEEERSLKMWQETEKIRIQSHKEQIEFAMSQISMRIDSFEEEVRKMTEKHQKDKDNLSQSEEELKQIDSQLSNIQKKSENGKDTAESLNEEKDMLTNKKSEYQITITELEKDIQAVVREEENDSLLNISSEKRAKQLAEELESNQVAIEDCYEKIKENNENIVLFEKKYSNFKSENSHLRIKRDEQDKLIRNLQDGMKENISSREKVSSEITRLEEKNKLFTADYDKIINRLLEEYEVTRSEARELAKPVEDVSALKNEIFEIKNKIRKLGSVNLEAIEEYREVAQRYEFLTKQLSDIKSSKKELENLIVKLTDEMSVTFSKSFQIINQNFKEIFVELFGGGKAELRLTDPENVLESGIDIIVAPPGKVIKNLISLSGGEQAFIAIAIYFAILRLRPSPFCILDEIDAALDEANVRKYARYLKNFTDTTQFILVTHRRGAMEEAGVLYGVTMQEDGISKLLKLDQREALEQADK
jgi:chromosome segregation protein